MERNKKARAKTIRCFYSCFFMGKNLKTLQLNQSGFYQIERSRDIIKIIHCARFDKLAYFINTIDFSQEFTNFDKHPVNLSVKLSFIYPK